MCEKYKSNANTSLDLKHNFAQQCSLAHRNITVNLNLIFITNESKLMTYKPVHHHDSCNWQLDYKKVTGIWISFGASVAFLATLMFKTPCAFMVDVTDFASTSCNKIRQNLVSVNCVCFCACMHKCQSK